MIPLLLLQGFGPTILVTHDPTRLGVTAKGPASVRLIAELSAQRGD
jgi:hypothetical protein